MILLPLLYYLYCIGHLRSKCTIYFIAKRRKDVFVILKTAEASLAGSKWPSNRQVISQLSFINSII